MVGSAPYLRSWAAPRTSRRLCLVRGATPESPLLSGGGDARAFNTGLDHRLTEARVPPLSAASSKGGHPRA